MCVEGAMPKVAPLVNGSARLPTSRPTLKLASLVCSARQNNAGGGGALAKPRLEPPLGPHHTGPNMWYVLRLPKEKQNQKINTSTQIQTKVFRLDDFLPYLSLVASVNMLTTTLPKLIIHVVPVHA